MAVLFCIFYYSMLILKFKIIVFFNTVNLETTSSFVPLFWFCLQIIPPQSLLSFISHILLALFSTHFQHLLPSIHIHLEKEEKRHWISLQKVADLSAGGRGELNRTIFTRLTVGEIKTATTHELLSKVEELPTWSEHSIDRALNIWGRS